MAHWKARETVFSQYGFEVTLPGHWQARDTGDAERWLYRSGDRKEQLTITRWEITSIDDEPEVVERTVARHRRAVELGFGRLPDLTLEEPVYDDREGFPLVGFAGSAEGELHRMRSQLVFEERVVWVLFYEAFRMRPQEAEERGAQIVASASVTPEWQRQRQRR